jgi:Curli production assembly/transport component CsgG
MTKLKLVGVLLLFSLFCSSIVKAQTSDTSKVRIAVLPFVLSQGALIGNPGDVVTIQGIVASEFTSLSRFVVLNRADFQKIIDELKIQSSEQFLNGQIVAQGKQIGAKYLVTGVVNEYRVARTRRPDPRPAHLGQEISGFSCDLKMNFGVIDVETGQSLFINPINVSANDLVSMVDSATAAKAAMTNMQTEVSKKIKLILAGQMRIIAMGKMDKGGLPKTVLTNGGGDIIKDGDKTKVILSTIQKIGDLERYLKIGELTHPNVQKEIVEWEVSHSDAKAILDAFNAKTTLVITVDTHTSPFHF